MSTETEEFKSIEDAQDTIEHWSGKNKIIKVIILVCMIISISIPLYVAFNWGNQAFVENRQGAFGSIIFILLGVSVLVFLLSALGLYVGLKGNQRAIQAAERYLTDHKPVPAPAPMIQQPDDPEIVKARKLAEIEMQKAEHMARLRLAEAQGLAGIAAEVAEKEEARQDRQLDKLTKI